MEKSVITTDSIYVVLSKLIEEKSRRDKVNFTSSRLANELNVDRSLISRLIHEDPSRRVTNPTSETLVKIVNYFRNDGFDISVDDLLGIRRTIDIQAQNTKILSIDAIVPLYALDDISKKIGTVEAKLTSQSQGIIALYTQQDIEPIFNQGSIFFIDPELEPEDNTLVAVKLNNSNSVLIRNFKMQGRKQVLKSYSAKEDDITLLPTMDYLIIGVVVQVIPNTSS